MPSHRGAMMVDVTRNVLRVRAWPKKRGRPKSALQLYWVDWFRQANALAKLADNYTLARAIELTKNTGWYPRDIILKAMAGRLYTWTDSTGWTYYSMAAITDISKTLDILAQTVGSLLVRHSDRWKAPAPGILSDVLISQGPGVPPIFGPSPGSGGVVEEVITGTPIVVDNTASTYDIDISAYTKVVCILDHITFNASDRAAFRFSVDDGATFKSGAGDYTHIWQHPTSSGTGDVNEIRTSNGPTAAVQNARFTLDNLRAGRASIGMVAGMIGSVTITRDGFVNFAGPITNIRIYARAAQNFKTGTIRMVGTR